MKVCACMYVSTNDSEYGVWGFMHISVCERECVCKLRTQLPHTISTQRKTHRRVQGVGYISPRSVLKDDLQVQFQSHVVHVV